MNQVGEAGLTFRALSERLKTGPGAIYWYLASKDELLAACDAIVTQALGVSLPGSAPEASIRALALGTFDAIAAHPWVGSALIQARPLAVLRIFERIGQQVCALGVPQDTQWTVASALLNYILGVSGQNAAQGRDARARSLGRGEVLGERQPPPGRSWMRKSSHSCRASPPKYPATTTARISSLGLTSSSEASVSGLDVLMATWQWPQMSFNRVIDEVTKALSWIA